MRYFIDGYNFLFRLSEIETSLEKSREGIISFLQLHAGRKNLDVTLIFDGADKEASSHFKSLGPLHIAYSAYKQSADNYILEQIDAASNPKSIVVVTSDKRLCRMVHAMQARTQSVENFIAFLLKQKISREKPTLNESPRQIERLEKIFLDRLKKESS
jgi:uncharacterized protein